MQAVHEESIRQIEQQLHFRDQTLQSKNIYHDEYKFKVIKNSESLFEAVNMEGLFLMLPDIDFGYENDRNQYEPISNSKFWI